MRRRDNNRKSRPVSGIENAAPRVGSANKQPVDLKESAERAASLISEKIDQSLERTDKMLTQIAKAQNKIDKKKMGFESKLKIEKEALKEKYHQLLTKIQGNVAVQLSENEKIALIIASITDEINKLSQPIPTPTIEPVKVDLSKKTEKILKQKEQELKEKCTEEFAPLFTQLEQQHADLIESMNVEFEEEVNKINEEAAAEINQFIPHAFITQEEIRVRQIYENLLLQEKSKFEAQREQLKGQISIIENERDKEMQRVTDEYDDQIFEEEQLFNKQMEMISSSIDEPEMPDISSEFVFTPEQEEEFRRTAESKLKKDFEQRLQIEISHVAQRRESMKTSVKQYEEERLKTLDTQIKDDHERITDEINAQEKEIEEIESEINNKKSEWSYYNSSRKENGEILQDLSEKTQAMQKQLNEINKELEELKSQEEPHYDEMFEDIQQEMVELGKEVSRTKKYYLHNMQKLKNNHANSMQIVQQRVIEVKTNKDETISKLRAQLKATKSRTKHLAETLQSRINQYE